MELYLQDTPFSLLLKLDTALYPTSSSQEACSLLVRHRGLWQERMSLKTRVLFEGSCPLLETQSLDCINRETQQCPMSKTKEISFSLTSLPVLAATHHHLWQKLGLLHVQVLSRRKEKTQNKNMEDTCQGPQAQTQKWHRDSLTFHW